MAAEQKGKLSEVIWVDPERVSGTPCFKGTRVPVQNLLDYIEGGSTINEFLKIIPPSPAIRSSSSLNWPRNSWSSAYPLRRMCSRPPEKSVYVSGAPAFSIDPQQLYRGATGDFQAV
jgi:hypothetical protein